MDDRIRMLFNGLPIEMIRVRGNTERVVQDAMRTFCSIQHLRFGNGSGEPEYPSLIVMYGRGKAKLLTVYGQEVRIRFSLDMRKDRLYAGTARPEASKDAVTGFEIVPVGGYSPLMRAKMAVIQFMAGKPENWLRRPIEVVVRSPYDREPEQRTWTKLSTNGKGKRYIASLKISFSGDVEPGHAWVRLLSDKEIPKPLFDGDYLDIACERVLDIQMVKEAVRTAADVRFLTPDQLRSGAVLVVVYGRVETVEEQLYEAPTVQLSDASLLTAHVIVGYSPDVEPGHARIGLNANPPKTEA